MGGIIDNIYSRNREYTLSMVACNVQAGNGVLCCAVSCDQIPIVVIIVLGCVITCLHKFVYFYSSSTSMPSVMVVRILPGRHTHAVHTH